MPQIHNKYNRRLIVFTVILVIIAVSFTITYNKLLDSYSDKSYVGDRVVKSLTFVVVISRHGNRAGLFTFPNDPYPKNNIKFWPYGSDSDASSFGRIQMFDLGLKVRSLYNGFLGADYYPGEFFATSTTMTRTLVSGEAFLAGLFPPTGHQSWNKKIPSQLVPLFSTSPDKSSVASKCEMIVHLRKLAMDRITRDNMDQLQMILHHIIKYTGFNATDINAYVAVWDALVSEDIEGFPLPDWTKDIYPEPMENLSNKLYKAYSADSDVLARLLTGLLFKDIVETMMNKTTRKLIPDRKMIYYSGHDHTLLSLQHIFGIPTSLFNSHVRPASALVVELHEDPKTNDSSVQLLFIGNGPSDLTLQTLPIPECGSPCTIQQLAEVTKRFTSITDYKKECKITSTPDYCS